MSVLCFFPEINLKFIVSAEPARATHEQLCIWCHRWFCRYRIEYTVGYSAISTFMGNNNMHKPH